MFLFMCTFEQIYIFLTYTSLLSKTVYCHVLYQPLNLYPEFFIPSIILIMSLPFICNRSIKQIVIEVLKVNFKVENSLLFGAIIFSFPFPMFEFQRKFFIGNRKKFPTSKSKKKTENRKRFWTLTIQIYQLYCLLKRPFILIM